MNVSQLSMKVKSKQHFYDAILLDGKLLPKCKSPFCSNDFLKSVFSGEVWVPKGEETFVRPVRYAPSAKLLQAYVVEELQQKAQAG